MTATITQFLRYAVVGLTSNAVGYVIYLALTANNVSPKLSMTILYVIGIFQTFVFNKRWSFQYFGRNRIVFLKYCLTYGLGYAINYAILVYFVDILQLPHQIVQGVTILGLACLIFTLQKLWVFRQS
ncbi:GtrA family protein [Thauera sp. WH-1]|uniref:GtrA family protein n=1 Tax=Thauera sp. WH-1 TaxID=3398230 RepID=UPI0039FC1139